MKIDQEALKTYLATEQEIKSMRAQLARSEAERDKLAGELLARLDVGDGIAAGPLTAEVIESQRVTVAWAQVFAARCGQEEADAVRAQTAPTVTRKVTVRLRAGHRER